MKKLFLIGGGGHCKSCIDVIELQAEYKIQGIFDLKEKIGEKILGYEIIGADDDIANFVKPEHFFLITVGQIKSSETRERIYQKLISLNANLAKIISPRAYVSKHSTIKPGTIVMHDALINASASIGENCIINTKALIEHDAKVGNHCHVSTAAVVNGNCIINDSSFIGSNSVLRESIELAKGIIVPAGEFYNGK